MVRVRLRVRVRVRVRARARLSDRAQRAPGYAPHALRVVGGGGRRRGGDHLGKLGRLLAYSHDAADAVETAAVDPLVQVRVRG